MKSGHMIPLAAALLMGATACQDLQVDNTTSPGRIQSATNPQGLQSFAGGTFFPTLYQGLYGRLSGTTTVSNSNLLSSWPLIGPELTATLSGDTRLMLVDFAEPRTALHNNISNISVGNDVEGPRMFWADVHKAASNASFALSILNDTVLNLKIVEGGDTVRNDRARAFSKLIQGWSWGSLAVMFDKANYANEFMPVPVKLADMVVMGRETLVEWPELLDSAFAALEEAREVARSNPSVVKFPAGSPTQPLWFGTTTAISNGQFIELVNTIEARLIVLSARTPADRAALPWARVEALTRAGLKQDLRFRLETTNRGNALVYRAETVQTNSGNVHSYRMDPRGTFGLADQSGEFQRWLAKPVATPGNAATHRYRFDVITPDLRITGRDTINTATPNPKANGAYVRYRPNNENFNLDRGTYLFSAYQWGRHAIETGASNTAANALTGSVPVVTAVENDLLLAEALYFLGGAAGTNDAEVAALINKTRTRGQTVNNGLTFANNLPAVTPAGAPEVDGYCVPRQETAGNAPGACGTLYDALRYERMLELFTTDIIRGYADARGFGMLADGTILSWPVPGNALDMYKLPYYTAGGKSCGNANAACYAPVHSPVR
ncbi:MAG: hypothetical protein LBG44_10900 [Gemmatimonadota bacterium]|jgi:hypothetical protein|nr:hypothetical protein [Gemmatimonadota bacterium]